MKKNDYNTLLEYIKIKHKGQMYGDVDYYIHPVTVAQLAIKYLPNYPRLNQLMLLLLGHDLFEDTDATKEELLLIITPDIIDNIDLLTDGEGRNRKERHLNTYYRIRENEEAVLGKLLDRIGNISESKKGNEKKFNMYKKEGLTFKFALYDPRHSYARILWEIYDDLLK